MQGAGPGGEGQRETRRRAACGQSWPDGWSGWGRGKMTRLGSQALGSWGTEGPGPHQRGRTLGSGHSPTLLSWGSLFDVCVLGGVQSPRAALPAPHAHGVLRQLPGVLRPGAQGGGLALGGAVVTPRGLSGPHVQLSTCRAVASTPLWPAVRPCPLPGLLGPRGLGRGVGTEGEPHLPRLSRSTSGCWSCPGAWWASVRPATPPSPPPSSATCSPRTHAPSCCPSSTLPSRWAGEGPRTCPTAPCA